MSSVQYRLHLPYGHGRSLWQGSDPWQQIVQPEQEGTRWSPHRRFQPVPAHEAQDAVDGHENAALCQLRSNTTTVVSAGEHLLVPPPRSAAHDSVCPQTYDALPVLGIDDEDTGRADNQVVNVGR